MTSGLSVPFKSFAFNDDQIKIVGCQKYILEKSGLSVKDLTKKILRFIADRKLPIGPPKD
jgi:hypothetical protein